MLIYFYGFVLVGMSLALTFSLLADFLSFGSVVEPIVATKVVIISIAKELPLAQSELFPPRIHAWKNFCGGLESLRKFMLIFFF